LEKTQNPKPGWGQAVIIEDRADGETFSFHCQSALLVPPATGWWYRGDSRSCRIIYPINGLHQPIVAG
jgi:hypothetical protein